MGHDTAGQDAVDQDGADRVPTRTELRAHLLAARIAGDVRTSRESNLRSYGRIANADPYDLFGLEPDGDWPFSAVLALLARRCGVSPDPEHTQGQDRIDPDLTLAGLDAVADRLAEAARRREPVLFASGHPTGLLALYLPLVAALAAAGCPVLRPGSEARVRGRNVFVRYVGGVALACDGGGLVHTHAPEPMQVMLAALTRSGEPEPGLVVADHGWAGAAGQAGMDTVGFADCNDPALFIGAEEGRVRTVVPLDDNVEPVRYGPLTAYVLARAGLRGGRVLP